MKPGLVTLITPCYNMAPYISRLLHSVLEQTYPHIEMFVVDDGSTDGSADVVESFKLRFRDRGYRLTCIRQANAGQSAAIQNALPLVQGEFLAWPDADDFYTSSQTIALMVDRLRRAPARFAMVRCQEEILEDGTFRRLMVTGRNAHDEEPASLFEDCLFVRNGYYFCPGAYMVRFEALKEVTGLSIYTHPKAGQNWQLMLPVLYHYRCLTIRQVLYTVISRRNSHSREADYETCITRAQVYLDTLLGTLDRIQGLPATDKKRWSTRLIRKYTRDQLYVAALYHRADDFRDYYARIDRHSLADCFLALAVRAGFTRQPFLREVFSKLYRNYYGLM